MPVTYFVPGESTSPRWAEAFAAGYGGRAVPISTTLQRGPFAAFCTPPTWPLLKQAQDEGRDWYYGDHGLFSRGKYYRVTKNAYQPSGIGSGCPTRFAKLGVPLARQWKKDGSTVVVCPNSPVYMRHYTGEDPENWVSEVVSRLMALTDRRVVVRWKTDVKERPLSVDLQTAWMVVTFSSASAVEALASGIPICTLAPWASTASMGITDLSRVERPYYPDLAERDRFLFNLANQQFTLDEMRQGLAWHSLESYVQ